MQEHIFSMLIVRENKAKEKREIRVSPAQILS